MSNNYYCYGIYYAIWDRDGNSDPEEFAYPVLELIVDKEEKALEWLKERERNPKFEYIGCPNTHPSYFKITTNYLEYSYPK